MDIIEKDVEIQNSQSQNQWVEDDCVVDGSLELIVEEFQYLEIL